MKIFLVNTIIGMDFSYYYGLGYVASMLKENGHTVKYITLNNTKNVVRLYSSIKKEAPEIIAFSSASSQFIYVKDITKKIKKISSSFVVYGGIHATLYPECIFESASIDAVVRGEGEFPMRDLVEAFKKREDYRQIRNFWFMEDGKVIKNECRDLIANLDRLPFPDKSSLNYQEALDKMHGSNRFIFSRGCVFDCPYCSNKALMDFYRGKGVFYRSRSPQKAIEEIELDSNRYNFDMIYFDDDLMPIDKRWFYQFFDLYKRKFKYPFHCNIRPNTIDSNMARLLKEAGAGGMTIGIEHGNERFRKDILKRNITDEQIVNTFKLFERHGINDNYGQIMIGLPHEDINLFLDSVRLCRQLKASYWISIFSPYPKTHFGKLCEENNWLPDNFYYAERRKAVIDYPKFKKKDIQLCYDIFNFLMYYKFLPLNSRFLNTINLFRLYRLLVVFWRLEIRLRVFLKIKSRIKRFAAFASNKNALNN